MTLSTKLGVLREARDGVMSDINWLEEQRAVVMDAIRRKNETLYELEQEIESEIGRLRPLTIGQPVSIEFVGNPDD